MGQFASVCCAAEDAAKIGPVESAYAREQRDNREGVARHVRDSLATLLRVPARYCAALEATFASAFSVRTQEAAAVLLMPVETRILLMV